MESKYISINGAQLNYGEGPENGPALFFLGGFPSTWDGYGPLYELLVPHYHVFSLTQRGLGHSEKAASYSIRQWIHDSQHFVQAVMEPPVLGIGHSAGAWIGLATAVIEPELYKAFICLDQPLNPEDHLAYNEDRVPTVRGIATAMREATDGADLSRRLAQVPLPEGGIFADVLSEAELAEEAATLVQHDPVIYDAWVKGELAAWIRIPELQNWPGEYRKPLLFLDGDPDAGSLVTPVATAYNREHFPWAERVQLAGLDHGLGMWQEPALVVAEIRRFFDALTPQP